MRNGYCSKRRAVSEHAVLDDLKAFRQFNGGQIRVVREHVVAESVGRALVAASQFCVRHGFASLKRAASDFSHAIGDVNGSQARQVERACADALQAVREHDLRNAGHTFACAIIDCGYCGGKGERARELVGYANKARQIPVVQYVVELREIRIAWRERYIGKIDVAKHGGIDLANRRGNIERRQHPGVFEGLIANRLKSFVQIDSSQLTAARKNKLTDMFYGRRQRDGRDGRACENSGVQRFNALTHFDVCD